MGLRGTHLTGSIIYTLVSYALALHANKRPKHDGSIFGRQNLWRERIKGHNKLMRSYFVDDPIIHEKNMFSSIFE
jgi:hypothetical protein